MNFLTELVFGLAGVPKLTSKIALLFLLVHNSCIFRYRYVISVKLYCIKIDRVFYKNSMLVYKRYLLILTLRVFGCID